MRLVIIGCQVFFREICAIAAQSKNIITTIWLPQGLHDTPDKLRESLIGAIEKASLIKFQQKYKPDAILLAYGLCSRGVVGIKSGEIPVVIPKTDDCIALFLGSQKRYLENFNSFSGVYWYNPGWLENAHTPSKEDFELKKIEYKERFEDDDTVDFLMEQEYLWVKNYNYGIYINSDIYNDSDHKKAAREKIKGMEWEYKELDGDSGMFKRMINGEWNEDFLIVPPNHEVKESFDEGKIKASPIYTNPQD